MATDFAKEDAEDAAAAAQRPLYVALRPGPFISGTTHQVLQLGQRPVLGDAADLLADPDAGAGRGGASGATGEAASGAKRGKSGGGGISLADLLAAGFIKPGRNKVSVTFKGEKYAANLTKDGTIIWQGKKYSSPTAFSVAAKRQAASGRQGNDGWRSTLYESAPLENYRRKYAAQFAAPLEDEEDLLFHDGAAEGDAAATGGAAEGTQPATDQWVQCDRCDTWRVVPDAHWPALEAADAETWACAEAGWDLLAMPPFTPACEQ